jgi:hypothetical protein
MSAAAGSRRKGVGKRGAALTLPRRSARFQVALGDKPGDEPAAVSLVVKGKETFIGTLRKAKCDQFSVRALAAAQPSAEAVAASRAS